MSTNFLEVGKYIADKLVIALLMLAATVYGNYFLEKYKMSVSVSVYDSHEFMKRIDILWSKAYEVEDAANEIDVVYKDYNDYNQYDMSKFIWSNRDFDKEIKEKKLVLDNRFSDFWDLRRQNKFYLGEAVTDHIFWYVRLALAYSDYEKRFSETIKSRKDFASISQYPDEQSKMKETLEKEYKQIVMVKEATRKSMEKLRFEFSDARKYSLVPKP